MNKEDLDRKVAKIICVGGMILTPFMVLGIFGIIAQMFGGSYFLEPYIHNGGWIIAVIRTILAMEALVIIFLIGVPILMGELTMFMMYSIMSNSPKKSREVKTSE